MDTLLILTGFFCCALTSLSLGLVMIRLLKVEAGKTESLALGYIAGSAANSLMILALGLEGALSKNIFAGITIFSLLVLWKQRKWFANLAGTSEKEPSLPAWSKALLFLVIAPYCAIYFRQAMSPEMSPDATAYHLGLVNLWVHAGRIYKVGSMFAAIPHGMEMLYLFAFTIGRHSAAALIHFSFLLDLALLMYCFGRRFGWGTSASLFAPVLVFASPLFGTIGTVAYIDVALSAVVLAAIYLLQIWRQTHSSGTLIACGLVSGFAVAIKYTAAPLPLFIAIAVAWELRKSGRLATRALLALLLAMAVLPGPYLIRNWVWFDNPIAFFGNAIFPNPWFHISLERSFRAQMADYGGVTWRELPQGLRVGGAKLPNSFGTVFLLTPVCLLGLIWARSRTITLAALALASVYAAHKDPRFLMPAIPLATLAVAYVLGRIPRASVQLGTIAAVHLVISWPAFMDSTHFPSTWQWRLHPITWREALRREPEEKYLAAHAADYVMSRFIEAQVPQNEPVLAFTGGAFQSYTTRQIVICWQSAYGERMADLLFSKWHSPKDERQRFSFSVPPVSVKRIKIVQDGKGDGVVMWNVDEIEIRSEGKRLMPTPGGQLDASPNHWDAATAFDGDPSTRWRSWDFLGPGMFISADFGVGRRVDSVDVILDNREWTPLENAVWRANVSLIVTTADGREISVAPVVSMDTPADLRKLAAQALRNNGIHHLLINGNDWKEQEFRGHAEAWNLHALAATADATLYRID